MQRRSYIQYDSNRGGSAALAREETRQWQVIENPYSQAAVQRRRTAVTRRARRLSRALCVAACGILVTGMVAQITMSVALKAQSKRQSELYAQIQTLQRNTDVKKETISNLSADGRIEQEAQKLGMVFPQEGQLRALSVLLPAEGTQMADAQP